VALSAGLPLATTGGRGPQTAPAISSQVGAASVAAEPAASWGVSRSRLRVPVAPWLDWLLMGAMTLAAGVRAVALVRAIKIAEAWRRAASDEIPLRAAQLQVACAKLLGLGAVQVLAAEKLPGPVTMGFRRPVVLLPDRFGEGQSDDVVLAALGHEMAHIRRRDYALNLCYEVLMLPLAWHPAVRLLRRRIDETREMACDEMVAGRIMDNRRYARSLVAIAAAAARKVECSPALGVTDGDILNERVRRLVSGSPRVARWPVAAGLSVLAAAGFGASLAALDAGALGDPVAGTWQGRAGAYEYSLRLAREGERVSGRLDAARVKPLPRPAGRVVGELGPVPATAPPPPPPPPPPPSGMLEGGALSGRLVRFRAGGVDFELQLLSSRTAVLRVVSARKTAHSRDVAMVKSE
jgi:beta-lactamase regulating signal transducer with metallopeptidase domain